MHFSCRIEVKISNSLVFWFGDGIYERENNIGTVRTIIVQGAGRGRLTGDLHSTLERTPAY